MSLQTKCSIKDSCYRVSHCGLSDSLSVTFNVVLIRTGTNKNNLVIHIGPVIKLMFLKVILRIIRITLSERVTSFHRLCFVQQKPTGWSVGAQSSWACIVLYTLRRAILDQKLLLSRVTMSPIRFTCHVTQSRSSDSSLWTSWAD